MEQIRKWQYLRRIKKTNQNILAEYLDTKEKMLRLNSRIDYLKKNYEKISEEAKHLEWRLERVRDDMRCAMKVAETGEKKEQKDEA